MASRHLSRSSGAISSQRALIRWRQYEREPPRKLPRRMRLRNSKPMACQKVMGRRLNNRGISQFQRLITTNPNKNPNTATPTSASGANFKNRLIRFRFIFLSLLFVEFIVDVTQPPAQVDHGVMLARHQCV